MSGYSGIFRDFTVYPRQLMNLSTVIPTLTGVMSNGFDITDPSIFLYKIIYNIDKNLLKYIEIYLISKYNLLKMPSFINILLNF